MRIDSWMRMATVLALAMTATAADPFYIGNYKIVTATVAPWTEGRKPDPAESKTLVGKAVTIKANEIVGPRQLACKGPKYQVKDYPADMLFQGAFGEMHLKDKSADPVKLAEKVGFQGKSWKTVETGCATELDLHFIDTNSFAFGLNDYVYTVKKQ